MPFDVYIAYVNYRSHKKGALMGPGILIWKNVVLFIAITSKEFTVTE